jgi:hypothetical protein
MASMAFAVGLPDRKDRARVAKKRVTIEAKHRDAVARKREKIKALKALIEEWEAVEQTDETLETIRDLKRRLRTAEAQKAAMRP